MLVHYFVIFWLGTALVLTFLPSARRIPSAASFLVSLVLS